MKDQSYFGIDEIEFKMNMKNPTMNLSRQALTTPSEKVYGYVEVRNGWAHVYICLPKYLRNNNVIPFGVKDIEHLDDIRNEIIGTLRHILGDINECVLVSVECNITMKIQGENKINQVLNLFHLSFCNTVNIVYEGPAERCKYQKEKQTLISRRRNYYILKYYDKSRQQRQIGNVEIEDGYLRLENKMLNRTIKRIFGSTINIEQLLRAENLKKIADEYCRIFCYEVIASHVFPCLTGIKNILIKSLNETQRPIETLRHFQHLVVDQEVFREALREWYVMRGEPDSSREAIFRLKKCEMPKNVMSTVKDIHNVCDLAVTL